MADLDRIVGHVALLESLRESALDKISEDAQYLNLTTSGVSPNLSEEGARFARACEAPISGWRFAITQLFSVYIQPGSLNRFSVILENLDYDILQTQAVLARITGITIRIGQVAGFCANYATYAHDEIYLNEKMREIPDLILNHLNALQAQALHHFVTSGAQNADFSESDQSKKAEAICDTALFQAPDMKCEAITRGTWFKVTGGLFSSSIQYTNTDLASHLGFTDTLNNNGKTSVYSIRPAADFEYDFVWYISDISYTNSWGNCPQGYDQLDTNLNKGVLFRNHPSLALCETVYTVRD